jgi:5'-3' exonuclease
MLNVLIDGHYLFHKTFGIFSGYGTKEPNEILGHKNDRSMFIRKLATDLCSSLKQIPITGRVVFVSDSRSWRKDIPIEGGGYKSNRVKSPQVDWSIFFSLINEFGQHLEQKGFIFSKVEGAEGDDLLYFWSKYFNEKGENCLIVSGDKDMDQLARWTEDSWTVVWSSNSKNNTFRVPLDWGSEYLNKKTEITVFDLGESISPEKKKIQELVGKCNLEEIDAQTFVFLKMLEGDKGDAVPSVWEVKSPDGKTFRITPKKAQQILDSVKESGWSISDFRLLLMNGAFLEWISGFVLRLMKDLDNEANRQKVVDNFQRNFSLMWLDNSVIPEAVADRVTSQIKGYSTLSNSSVPSDWKILLEGTEWLESKAPSYLDPFLNYQSNGFI